MNGVFFIKKGIILLTLFALSGCASITTKFPEYGSSVRQHSTIPVVLDLFVYRDILGQKRGFNQGINNGYLEEAVAQVDSALTERGFSMGRLITTNGLTHEVKSSVEYVISEDWKSTGELYDPNLNDQEKNPWNSSEAKELFSMVFKVAKEINETKGEGQFYAQKKVMDEAIKNNEEALQSLGKMKLPASLFDGLDSDIVLLVRIDGRFQKLSKYLTQGLLVGAVSNALTGGLVVVPPGSYTSAGVAAFNIKTRQILWYNSEYAEGKNSVSNSIEYVFKRHPYSDGETAFEKKIKKKKESRARSNLTR